MHCLRVQSLWTKLDCLKTNIDLRYITRFRLRRTGLHHDGLTGLVLSWLRRRRALNRRFDPPGQQFAHDATSLAAFGLLVPAMAFFADVPNEWLGNNQSFPPLGESVHANDNVRSLTSEFQNGR